MKSLKLIINMRDILCYICYIQTLHYQTILLPRVKIKFAYFVCQDDAITSQFKQKTFFFFALTFINRIPNLLQVPFYRVSFVKKTFFHEKCEKIQQITFYHSFGITVKMSYLLRKEEKCIKAFFKKECTIFAIFISML